MSLFIPITKVDSAQRLVYGTISEEVPDKAGEILDYESSRPAFEEWSRQFHTATGGKSLGNVRAMHGAIAVGKLTDIRFDDTTRRIEGVAKIVDEGEWNKVIEGIYTGFSIGGGYAKRWQDPENPRLMRYTPVLSEVSLVDNPAVPTATFQFIKQDGSIELRKFDRAQDKDKAAELSAGLDWLLEHAQSIGAKGLEAHITAIQDYLNEADEKDFTKRAPDMDAPLKDEITQLRKRITHLEAQPMPAKGVLRAIGKHDDRLEASEPAVVSTTHELMKIALANPILA